VVARQLNNKTGLKIASPAHFLFDTFHHPTLQTRAMKPTDLQAILNNFQNSIRQLLLGAISIVVKMRTTSASSSF
jgi:hypothetical protein